MADSNGVIRHVQRLGLEECRAYADWCRQTFELQGFPALQEELFRLGESRQTNMPGWFGRWQKYEWLYQVVRWQLNLGAFPKKNLLELWSESVIRNWREGGFFIRQGADPFPQPDDLDSVPFDFRDSLASWPRPPPIVIEDDSEGEDNEAPSPQSKPKAQPQPQTHAAEDADGEDEDELMVEEQQYSGSRGIDPQLTITQNANAAEGGDSAAVPDNSQNDYFEDDFGGGFEDNYGGYDASPEQGFAGDSEDEGAEIPSKTPPSQGSSSMQPQAASFEAVERPLDLGIGTSRGAAKPVERKRKTVTSEKSASAESPAPAGEERQKRHKQVKKPKARLQKPSVIEDEVDLSTLRLKSSSRRNGKQKKATKKVKRYRTRTSYVRKPPAPRPFDPFSEDNLLQHFDIDMHKRPTFRLNNFRLHITGTDEPFALDALTDPNHLASFLDLILVGDATPGDMAEDEEAADDLGGDGESAVRRVNLFTKYDRIKLDFHAGGPLLKTKLAYYRLVWPDVRYKPLVDDYRRLLNIFTFARSCCHRGDYAAEPSEIVELGDTIRKDIACLRGPLGEDDTMDWQRSLPSFWRVDADDLTLRDEAETRLIFNALPNIPWVAPSVARLILDSLPPHSFRAFNLPSVQKDVKREKRVVEKLYERYGRMLVKDENAPDLFDSPNLPRGAPTWERTHPSSLSGESAGTSGKVNVYKSVQAGGKTISAGDVVLIRPDKNAATSPSVFCAGDEDDDEDHDEPVAADEPSPPNETMQDRPDLWFGQVVYFLHEAGTDLKELKAHVLWFATPPTIPSLGEYGSARHLAQLDSCETIECGAIIGIVSDFTALKPGDAPPESGFYNRFRYSIEDGSFVDSLVLANSPTSCCTRRGFQPCISCETSIVHNERIKEVVKETKGKKGKKKQEKMRVLTPIASAEPGVLFALDGIPYHANDLILVRPHIEEGARYGPELPLRLARLLRVRVDAAVAPLEQIEVEWYVRANESGINPHGRKGFSSIREVIPSGQEGYIDTTRIEGRFSLIYLDIDAEDKKGNAFEAVSKAESNTKPTQFWTRRRCTRPPEAMRPEDWRDGRISLHEKDCLPVTADYVSSIACATCAAALREEEEARVKVEQALQEAKSSLSDVFRLLGTALYAGGGLLEIGLEQGCPPLLTKLAIEHHKPATEFMRSNALEDVRTEVETVSDNIERAFYKYASNEPPARPLFVSGGSPCQGFSSVNRYKTVNDLRCLEPFVFLSYLSIHRPLSGVFENVAAFIDHCLPIEGAKRGSFFKLFISSLIALGYQARWDVDDAAGQGVPQTRRRLIVIFALSGFPLPSAPSLLHAVKAARHQRNHTLLEEGRLPFRREPAADVAPHPAVTIADAISDLPSFGVQERFDKDADTYEAGATGPDYDAENPLQYKTAPLSTFARQSRLFSQGSGFTFTALTHHVCRSVSETVARRILEIGIAGKDGKKGNYHDLDPKTSWYPRMADWILRRPLAKRELFWARLGWDDRLAPLRTSLNLDGVSHGPRLHPEDNRSLSLREFLRSMGVPDFVEINFSSDTPDESYEEALRIIGNGVPVPFAAAYGRAFYDAIFPLLLSAVESGVGQTPKAQNVFEAEWQRINPRHEQEKATPEAAKAFLEREERIRGERDGRDDHEEEEEEEEEQEEEEQEEGGDEEEARSLSPPEPPVDRPSKSRPARKTHSALEPSSSSSASLSASPFASSASGRSQRQSTRPTSLETPAAPAPSARRNARGSIDLTLDSDEDDDMYVVEEPRKGKEKGKGVRVINLEDSDEE
ncbi:hypothetical protein JCM6882_002047 [Rhodosporidiobolus microsporus]